MKKILILGGFGFMGQNLGRTLDHSKYIIHNQSRRSGCDARDLETLRDKIASIAPDIIIMAAANVGSMDYVSRYAADVVNDNTLMYVNLYRAVADVNPGIKIINPISNCSYPGIIDIQDEDAWWHGPIHESVEAYGTPKKMAFVISKCYRRQHGVKTINVIIPNAYGPYDYVDESRTHAMNGIIMRMIKAQKNNDQEFSVWGSGTPIREWIYMPDAARVIAAIIDDDQARLPDPLNIAQQSGISINDSVEIVKTLLDYPVRIRHDLSKQDGAPIKILSKQKFDVFFPGFDFTDYRVGILETIKYYQDLL